MRFSCKSCQATFQTASGAPASAGFRCPSCGGEMAGVAEVVELWQDRVPTRRYDLDDLRARLDLEREEFARSRTAPRSADQVWFAAVQGRQVGPLSVAGISGLRARGQLSAASLVWREGWPSWVAAEVIAELRPILGLPEETLGHPFPVQPAEPAPPPFESTYAAAHAPPSAEPFAEPFLVQPRLPDASNEKTDPGARASGPPARALAEKGRATAPGAGERDLASFALAEDPAAQSPAAAPPALAAPPPPLATEAEPLAIAAPPAHSPALAPPLAAEPPAPPALPLADERALEQAASAVLAQARSAERAAAQPGAASTASASARSGSAAGAEQAARDAFDEITSPGARPPPAPPAAPRDERADLPGAPLDPSIHVIDLSAPASPAGELAPPRRSRGPSSQQWFSSADDKPGPDRRSLFVLAIALGLALVVLGLLMRSH